MKHNLYCGRIHVTDSGNCATDSGNRAVLGIFQTFVRDEERPCFGGRKAGWRLAEEEQEGFSYFFFIYRPCRFNVMGPLLW